ncbi:MAG: FkbM family methyltransferase, partial [Methanoculleus sp.]|uniref:FkbM family methyltransferase n=2 Tax=unclassified Methanoculleus TaxID=2619537 RepID=UPI002630C497|nr:FkbM family methyltransferase [Methanoculleus sp.]MDD3215556.1 FkbM family methyltransferase [Methanoculleus sp.]MDD4472145.1 FkbM family methyltransferase [Methanoculleus sp.]HOI57293.1 FkbM family methyltransferase [Methanoculleus sp.]
MNLKLRERAGVAVMQAGRRFGIGTVRIPFGVLHGKRWQFTSSIPSCALGTYEQHIAAVLQDRLKEGMVFFDIGANVGYYTLFASTLVGDDGRVVAFEPEPENMRLLIEHTRINRSTNVLPVQKALSDAPGILRFDGTAHTMCRLSDGGNIEVECTTLDAFIQESGVPPEILKMDIEGAEVRALHGADACLSEIRPEIILSIHDGLLDECLGILSGYDYTVEQLSPDDLYCVPLEEKRGKKPINSHPPRFDEPSRD